MKVLRSAGVAAGAAALVGGLLTAPVGTTQAVAATTLPRYDHVVLAMFENHARSEVLGSASAPYLTGLARQGANFTQSYAIQHPSQPNYLELFSGSNHGINGDSCPHSFAAKNLGRQLIGSGRSFAGYSEGLPSAGSAVCNSGDYARRHVPWANFTDLNQRVVNKPYAAFPSNFNRLPSHAWLIPNVCHDMHDCSVATGDKWAKSHLDAYARWAKTHNSLLIVTFDEDDSSSSNRIPTIFVGAHIKPGNYSNHIDHYTVLRTIEGTFRLPPLGAAENRRPISNVFTSAGRVTGLPASGRTYEITLAGSHRVIDDRRSSSARGTRMIVFRDHNGRNQRWKANRVAPGTYTFRNVSSHLCLDTRGSKTSGNRISQWTCTGARSQRWEIRSTGSGYRIVSAGSGLALRSAGSGKVRSLRQQHSGSTWEFVSVRRTALGD